METKSIFSEFMGKDVKAPYKDGSQFKIARGTLVTINNGFVKIKGRLGTIVIKENNIETAASNLGFIPQNYVKLEGKQAQQLLKLMEELEDHDDVQNVWANFDIDEEEITQYSA